LFFKIAKLNLTFTKSDMPLKLNPLTDKKLSDILNFLNSEEDAAFFETSRVDSENHKSMIFSRPETRIRFYLKDSLNKFFDELHNYLNNGYYLAGWISYEFGYLLEPCFADLISSLGNPLLADFGVYSSPVVIDHLQGEQKTSFCREDNEENFENKAWQIDDLRLNQKKEDYFHNIKRIKEYIESGDTYQVNYTLKLKFDFSGSISSFYRTLRQNQRVSYSAFLKTGNHSILSFSPELFFKKCGNLCTVKPMKGTMKRGKTLDEDKKLVQFLHNDIKNRSENIMIVDLLRNDLGRLSLMGDVKTKSLFDVETFETLHQMTSTIEGRIPEKTDFANLFKALFPCGSVTGAPKIRTMEIIHELELETRGVYTGGIGYFTPDGDAVFNVPIRTVEIDGTKGSMGIGSGVVYDSDSEAEWQECLLKGHFLSHPKENFSLIETMLWLPELQDFWLFDYHLNRLKGAVEYFNFQMPEREILENLKDDCKFDKNGVHRVRLLLNREGCFEVSAVPCELPKNMTCFKTFTGEPPVVCFAEVETDSSSPFLYHKTTNRKLYDREREAAVANGFCEVIFCNEKGEITEGAISNIFIEKEGAYYTPHISCGLLPGTCRQNILDKYPGSVSEKILLKNDLMNADAVYIANSCRGLVQVKLAIRTN
jgi:para-aminobenzoate synthetase / 4-amino-4-deoxychorismate lyase